MLPQFWLLPILASLALGVPVPEKMGLDKANKLLYIPKVEEGTAGTKTTLNDKVASSIAGHSAHGTGLSSSYRSVLDRKQDSSTSGQGSGTKPARSLTTGTSGPTSGGTSGGSSDGSSGGTSSDGGASKGHTEGGLHRGQGEHGRHGGGMKGGKMHEQVKSEGSSSTESDSDGTNTGTTTGSDDNTTGTTTGSDSTTSGTSTGTDGTTTSKSKYK